jgi:predicted enzyme involved in methoxymalonyl-ACP biosynthesis
LEIERAVLSAAISRIRAHGFQYVKAVILATNENMVCVDVYSKVGFEVADEKNDRVEYIFNEITAPQVPTHVSVTLTA